MDPAPRAPLLIAAVLAALLAAGALPAVVGQGGGSDPCDGVSTGNDCPEDTRPTRPTGTTTTTSTTVTTQPDDEEDGEDDSDGDGSSGSGEHPCEDLRRRWENRSGPSNTGSDSQRERARAQHEECKERHEEYEEREEAQEERREQARAARQERRDDAGFYRAQGIQGERGGFLVNGTHVSGTFVTFDFAPDGTLSNYSIVGTSFLLTVVLPGPIEDLDLVGHRAGNRIVLSGDGWKAEAADQPTGTLWVRSDGMGFSFTPTPGATLSARADGSAAWSLVANGTAAFLVTPSGASLSDENGTAVLETQDQAFFHAPATRALLPGVANLNRDALDEAVASEAVGAELTVLEEDGGLATQELNYAGMTLNVTGLADGSLEIVVDAEVEGPRLLVANLESGVLPQGNLTVRYYDVLAGTESEVPIAQAASLAAILNVANGGTLPSYWPVEDEDGLQLIVYIPHFSVHKIVLASAGIVEVLQRPAILWGAIGAVILVAGAGLFAAKPREEEEIL